MWLLVVLLPLVTGAMTAPASVRSARGQVRRDSDPHHGVPRSRSVDRSGYAHPGNAPGGLTPYEFHHPLSVPTVKEWCRPRDARRKSGRIPIHWQR